MIPWHIITLSCDNVSAASVSEQDHPDYSSVDASETAIHKCLSEKQERPVHPVMQRECRVVEGAMDPAIWEDRSAGGIYWVD